MSHFPSILAPSDEDVKRMLAAGVHLGSQNVSPYMNRYVWKVRPDGVHVINLAKTWEKLILAARIIAGIEIPSDVCIISSAQAGQRAALKFANFTGATAISGRFTPGTFTNQIQDKFIEPRLLLVTDPRCDHQAIKESAYVNLPTISLANVDSSLKYVDIVIPCNNRSTESVGLIYWFLTREVLRLKGLLSHHQPWDVMVDLFFYRPPEEKKKALEENLQQQNRPHRQGQHFLPRANQHHQQQQHQQQQQQQQQQTIQQTPQQTETKDTWEANAGGQQQQDWNVQATSGQTN